MALRLVDELSLRAVSTGEDESPRSQIVRGGEPTGASVPGAVLEAVVACGDRYLLFTTDDIPYEDSLHIVLVDASLRTLDAATLGSPYSTGRFAELELAPPDRVHFRFMGGTRWTVTLFPAAKARIAAFSDPKGVSRSKPLMRWFGVEGNPKPEL
jgi:hypothetical protein